MTAPLRPDELQAELEALAALGLEAPLAEAGGLSPRPEAVAELANAAAALAYGVAPVAPKPELKARLMALIAAEASPAAVPVADVAAQALHPAEAAAGAAAVGAAVTPTQGEAPPPPPQAAPAPTAPPKLAALPGGAPHRSDVAKAMDGKVVPFTTRRTWFWKAASAVFASGLALSLARVGYLEHALSESQALAARAIEAEAKLAEIEAKVQVASMPASLMQAAELRVASLAPKEKGAPGRARLFWSPKAASWMLVISGMPMPTHGHSYQAWAVGAKGPVNVGTFMPDHEGMAMVPISWPEGPGPGQAAAVSLENAMAPMPQPKGPIVLVGDLAGASI